MTTTGIPETGLSGVLRTAWVRDQLAHVLEHAGTDEPSGTWTGLACPDHGLALGTDVDTATLKRLSARDEIADLVWEAPADFTAEHGQLFQAAIRAHNAGHPEPAGQLWDQTCTLWSRAWAANHTVLELVQHAGLTRFSPAKPQRWVVASFEHHCGPHGLPSPHVHNIVLTGQIGRIAFDASFGRSREHALPAAQRAALRCPICRERRAATMTWGFMVRLDLMQR